MSKSTGPIICIGLLPNCILKKIRKLKLETGIVGFAPSSYDYVKKNQKLSVIFA